MLKELRIQNFAIIDKIEVTFGPGLNIISGETGAGKSILMDALFLILGGRASTDIIRRGCEAAIVEASFDISGDKEIQEFLQNLAIPVEDDLIVRRQVHVSGKNRILINGTLANATTLASITSRLVDLCSQHDQQLLMRAEEQLLWVDRFGGLEELREGIKVCFENWSAANKSLEAISTSIAERAQRTDFLRFQLQELNDATLSDDQEDNRLEQELKTLASAEQLFALSAEAESVISGSDSEPGFLSRVGTLLNKTKQLQAIDPRLTSLTENLDSLRLYATEASDFLRQYASTVEHNESRLEEIHARSALLGKLKRKYGPHLVDVLDNQKRFTKELADLENFDSSIADAKLAVANARNHFNLAAKELTAKRQKSAKDLAAIVVKELADLQMDRARFAVDFEQLEHPASTGLEHARYLIAANPGEPLSPLNKVASGGELSRIMLAIHNVISARGGVGVYLFDEVDAGIGGKTAAAVGAKIARVAQGHQVICITHLAQVACFASHHLRVEKEVKKLNKKDRTSADVKALTSESEKIQELARMLSGLGNDKTALANAAAMRSNALTQQHGSTDKKIKSSSTKARPREASL